MSHSLDFVGLDEKLFLLPHFITGNREFSRRERQYQGTQGEPSIDWDEYAARIRYIVSNELIEIAAKFRVIQDAAAEQVDPEYLRELGEECAKPRKIGTVLEGELDLTLREACNKIIHAKNFQLIFQNARSAQPRYLYSYWNGICQLSGSYSRKRWRVALDVYRWSESMNFFIDDLADNVEW